MKIMKYLIRMGKKKKIFHEIVKCILYDTMQNIKEK